MLAVGGAVDAGAPRKSRHGFVSCGVYTRSGGGTDSIQNVSPCPPAQRAEGFYRPQSRQLAHPFQAFTASAATPSPLLTALQGVGGPWLDMASDAALDLQALTYRRSGRAWVLAGPVGKWRYAWPRDTAFVIWAQARGGDYLAAQELLQTLAWMMDERGAFRARYIPGTRQVPDERADQLDGTGWFLWAARQVEKEVSVPQMQSLAQSVAVGKLRADLASTNSALAQALSRGGRYLLELTDNPRHLPPAGSDYQERALPIESLANAAMVAAGLEACGSLSAIDTELSLQCQARAGQVRQAIEQEFGPTYPRSVGASDVDAGLAFLLPPFQNQALPGAKEAWLASLPAQRRQNGGYTYGSANTEENAWTPETTLHALVAAYNGEEALREEILAWTNAHRTILGAIPEKVRRSGRAGGPAPLAWSGANVILTLLH